MADPYTAAGAVCARIAGNPALAALIPGGVERVVMPITDSPVSPYLVVSEISSVSDRNTGPGYSALAVLQVSAFGPDLDALGRIESALDALLSPLGSPRLPLADGYLTGLYLSQPSDGPGEQPQGGVRLYQRVLEFRALVVRNPTIPTP